MKKYKILALAMFACATLNGWAQSESNVTGKVLDKKGKPVSGSFSIGRRKSVGTGGYR